ncbi:helix-turn-helix transcriptional regulator [Streptomyces sp. Rer75]|uniref:helix-turn-helix domain-containing protein n=1 Tax=Streptomyces sp. Rer75 TaxID=2750011 RepID=UPI0015CFB62A|nr:helix-turn-helix transcriptional regulator [Streptomyces sp. Rer75]QLH25356.1 helix-turn-helix domain-containing protein [Streptomyces sp. Rer75]
MNKNEHHGLQQERRIWAVGGEISGDPEAALEELRNRLRTSMAERRLQQKDLMARTGLSRTTISQALSPEAPAPTRSTVIRLAQAVKITGREMEVLLDLLNMARDEAPASPKRHRYRNTHAAPIVECDPYDKRVHPAVDSSDPLIPRGRAAPLTSYVLRAHDAALAEVVREARAGASRLMVLVGSSSTGKTRACWEAIQPLVEEGWMLWDPFALEGADEVINQLGHVGPRTVVWLDEAQNYMGTAETGERVAAALHVALTDSRRAPVLVLGTLWEEDAGTYLLPRMPAQRDARRRVRQLLEGRTVTVPPTFSAKEVKAAEDTGDKRMQEAVTRTANGRASSLDGLPIVQFLAGAPGLVRRYLQASAPVRSVLEVAMDAFRLAREPVSYFDPPAREVPLKLLGAGACDYFLDHEFNQLPEAWIGRALADAGRPVHGDLAPLSRVKPRPGRSMWLHDESPIYRLADYLEQRTITDRARVCPPESFWQAAYDHLPPAQLAGLGEAAYFRHRLRWADRLWQKAATDGSTHILIRLAHLRVMVEDFRGAESLLEQAANAGDLEACGLLMSVQVPEPSYMQADLRFLENFDYRYDSDEGPAFGFWSQFGLDEAVLSRWEPSYRAEVENGDPRELVRLATLRELLGDQCGAEEVARQAADAGYSIAIRELEWMRTPGGHLALGAGGEVKRLWRYGLDADGTPSAPW